MMNIKGIFAVSLIAMVAVVAGVHTSNAVAAIASQGYVDQQVGLKANATELERKVDIYQGDAKANQAVITNGTGNITTGFITKSMLGADVEIPAAITVDSALSSTSTNPVQNKVINAALAGKQATLTTAQLDAVNSGITSNKVSTYDGYDEKITAAQTAADDAAEAAAAAQSTASGKLSSISGSTTGSGNVVTSVSASGSNVSANKGITAEETKNKVTSANYAANVSNDTKYPTVKAVANAIADVEEKIPAAITVDSALSPTSTNPVQNKVINTALAGKQATLTSTQLNAVNSGITKDKVTTYDGYNEKITAAQNAANAKVATEQGTDAENKAVITNSSGTITTGQIASGMIADDAVTTAKLAAGAVANDNLANSAVTSAKIADGTIVNADIAADAKIATSKISGLAKVATSGLYEDLTGTPTIPTVNDATLTIKKNGTSVGTFTANASADKEINIEVPAATTASDILTTTTVTSSGTGAVLTGVSVEAGKVTLQKGNVQIPYGGQSATSYVSIWVE